jgi:hypothetical protein
LKGLFEMNILTAVMTAVPSEAIDPGVKANANAPWLPLLRNIAGMLLVTCVIILVAVLVVGVVLWVGGKLASMSSAQSTGFMIMVWGLLGAAVIGSVSGLVYWATSQSLAPAPAAAAAAVLGLAS